MNQRNSVKLTILMIALVVIGIASASARAATFTVTNNADSGAGSLRTAIDGANTAAGLDTIQFSIAGAGLKTIALTSQLPIITSPVIIDGTTQPGASCTSVGGLLIELNGAGANAGAGQGGLEFTSGANGSTIRGLIINRFNGYGMYLNGTSDSFIRCNYIGTDATGSVDLGNNNSGVRVNSGNNNTFGGTTAGDRNVISGNNSEGLRIIGNNTQIQGNYIGTNAAGTAALSNGGSGVAESGGSANCVIGGTTAAARNVISGNGTGVFISSSSSGTIVRGNYIGTNAAGDAAIGNNTGVYFQLGANNSLIGGIGAGEANIIAFNTGNGITVDTNQTPIRNSFRGNRIYSNGALGIDLGGFNGTVTPNDAGDADTGANNLQNFPVISSVTASTIAASIDSTTTASAYPMAIDYYASTTCDASGNGEGEIYLGSTTVAAPGVFNFAYTPVAGKSRITATATDANGNTSEFSRCARTSTAAAVNLSGRVLNSNGRGIASAALQITDQTGEIHYARSNPFGFYRFNNIAAGQSVVVSVTAKNFQFAPTFINVADDIADLNFTAEAQPAP